MARVTGIGGVFLRARDPKALTAWYVEHLGFHPGAHGITFQWSDEVPPGTGLTTGTTPLQTRIHAPGTGLGTAAPGSALGRPANGGRGIHTPGTGLTTTAPVPVPTPVVVPVVN